MQNELSKELLTCNQAAEYLKCSLVFLWQKRKDGTLKYVKAGSKILIKKSSIDEFLGLDKKEGNDEK